ncbi:hypothetical protein [Nocardia sp. NPDC050175]|uniref:hypothetical protein n=1 Tax=Nocardia sp. NPDC050175 TaxID=3364317 RepID=UPI003789BEE7
MIDVRVARSDDRQVWRELRLAALALLLTVSPDNEHAVALYRRNGFSDAGCPGGPGPQRTMAKALRLS